MVSGIMVRLWYSFTWAPVQGCELVPGIECFTGGQQSSCQQAPSSQLSGTGPYSLG